MLPVIQCRRCHKPMQPGVYLGQTWNKARGPYDVSRYPCGPGFLARCLKCPECGHSVTELSRISPEKPKDPLTKPPRK